MSFHLSIIKLLNIFHCKMLHVGENTFPNKTYFCFLPPVWSKRYLLPATRQICMVKFKHLHKNCGRQATLSIAVLGRLGGAGREDDQLLLNMFFYRGIYLIPWSWLGRTPTHHYFLQKSSYHTYFLSSCFSCLHHQKRCVHVPSLNTNKW